MAFKTFTAGSTLPASDVNTYLMKQTVIVCTSGTRPGSPVEGMVIFETDTDLIQVYDGTSWIPFGGVGAWQTYTPTWTAATTNPVLNNGTIAGRYLRQGRLVTVQIKLTMGSSTTYGSGNWLFSLPSGTDQETTATFPLGVAAMGDASPVARYTGVVEVNNSTTVLVMNNNTGTAVTAAVPITWAQSDTLYLQFQYEAA